MVRPRLLWLLLCSLILVPGGSAAAQQSTAGTIVVLDASGSMWGQIDGVNKIVTARNVIRDVVPTLDPSSQLGLMAYGHNRKGDCRDIELLVPPEAVSGAAARIMDRVDAINPKGKTPLSAAVLRAAHELKHEEAPATVILVTDGLETCGADPCALGRTLEATGVAFTAHVVGFGLSPEEGAQVACLAEETGGRYFSANTAADLANALQQTVTVAPPAPVEPTRPDNNLILSVALSEEDPPLKEGEIQRLDFRLTMLGGADAGKEKRLGHRPSHILNVPAGRYSARAVYQGGDVTHEFAVSDTEVTHAVVPLRAGRADIAAILYAEAFELRKDQISWDVRNKETDRRLDIFAPAYRQVLGAGTYEIGLVIDRNPKSSPPPVSVKIEPGGTLEADIVAFNGRLAVTPLSPDGASLPDNRLRYKLKRIKDDGSPGPIVASKAGAKDPVYPLPGDYVLVLEDWGKTRRELEIPVRIGAGETLMFDVLMPEGGDMQAVRR